MSIPKEPRQQMINMMYLVLTALLALNVSNEVLNAFVLVNEGITNSNIALDDKNRNIYRAFEVQRQANPGKAQEFYDKAMQAQQISTNLSTFIESVKQSLITQSGGWEDSVNGILKNTKDLDTPTRIMIDQKRGDELEGKINETRSQLLALIPENERAEAEKGLTLIAEFPANNIHKKKTWSTYNFEMVPVIAAITILTKFQSDAKSSEAFVIEQLLSKIGKEDFKFDKLEAKVVAPSSYIMTGQKYKADIFVSAFDSKQNPEVLTGRFKQGAKVKDQTGFIKLSENPLQEGYKAWPVVDGMGKLEIPATAVGMTTVQGVIKVPKPNTADEFEYFPFESEYQTAQGGVVVSPDNLNVIYAGIDNPISVSVPGFPDEKVHPSVTKGKLNPGKVKGKYMVNGVVFAPNTTLKVVVAVDTEEGRKGVGEAEFRVKRVPDPIAAIAGSITEGPIKTGQLKSAPGVGAVLKDFDFEGVQFEVLEFEMLYIPKRQDPQILQNKGWRFDSKIKGAIEKAKPGDQIIFRKVKAKGPDGSTRNLNSIPLEVN